MGSSSSRSASDDQRNGAAVAAAAADRQPASASRRSSFRFHPETVNIEELMHSGSVPRSRWLDTANYGDRYNDSQGSSASRGEISAEPGLLLRGSSGGSSSSSSSSATIGFVYHTQLHSTSSMQGGSLPSVHTELDTVGSGEAGSSNSPSVPLQRPRVGSSRVHGEDSRDLPYGEGSRQSLDDERLHAVCETTSRRQRVNEMQERLRRCAGFPPSIDLHELERRGLMSSNTADAQHRMEVMSGTVHQGLYAPSRSGRDSYDMSAWAAPSFLHAWDHPELWEGSYVGPSSTVAGSGRTSPPLVESSSVRRGSSSGRESRRTSGRRLWDAFSRATSHRRSSPSMAATIDDNEDGMPVDDVEDMAEVGSLHGSRALDMEERRRRVRSQVWALRRLSNGLEGGPWHSGPCPANHHGHRCSCDTHGMVDDTNTRASISRIIILAEALFEVLDEIHRQSVALSQSAAVSRASLPAPSPVVDAIPTRIHSTKPAVICDEAAQCYICLVEYEDGDQIRILPCQHEYHKGCVDKWLKEVHRVCPLCRGDVCDVKPLESGLEAAV